MAYVPPKRKAPIKAIILGLVVLALGALGVWGYLQWKDPQATPEEAFTICGFNREKTNTLLQRTEEGEYVISDYLFYGESLNVFANSYDANQQDDVRRKSLELTNLCSQESSTYTMEDTADRQIDLTQLEPGFYRISINDDLVKKRLVYHEVLHSEPFTTVVRDGKVKHITLIADAAISEPALQGNDLFLQVEEATPTKDSYDVFLDPYGAKMINGAYSPAGSANGIDEATQMQEAAVILKEKLEAYGLRVALAKESADEVMGYYGDDGIMKRAYASKAKYYLELGMNASTQTAYAGTEVYYSNFSSNTMANALMYALKKQTSLSPSNAYTWYERSEGVAANQQTKGKNGEERYDMLPSLRESGGRISGAAEFSDAAEQNASFVQASRAGMQALSINFIYITNEQDVSIWNTQRDSILTALADAFVKSIHVREE